jgi:KUP system potassium uptake protein
MSLVLWTLTIVVAFKYVVLVLRADNDGEGGIFALYGLLHKYKRRGVGFLLPALMLGAGLLFGDGVITPAISVLSAVEGLKIATPMFEHAVIPVTVVVLTALFAMQYVGTARVGSIFGPVLLCWFVTIGLLGAHQVMRHRAILEAAYPLHGVRFLRHAGLRASLLVLGAVMLVVTGGEALYADRSGSRWSRPSSRRKGLSREPSRSLRRPSRWASSHACGSYTRTTRMRARSTCPSSIGRCTPDASCS